MRNERFKEISTEDLFKKKKTISLVTGILTGMLIVLIIYAVFLTINNGFPYLLVIPLGLSPILILNFNTVTNINRELKSRNTN